VWTEESRANHAMAQFSHELRNCLGTARNAMRVLEIRDLELSHRKKTRKLIARQLEQMTRLVDDLLDASLIRSGQFRLESERIDLREPLIHAAEAVGFMIRERRHLLHVDSPSEPVWIHGDAARLEQVFMNLLTNAAKYTPAGGAITVTVRTTGGEAVVAIRDTGVGIPHDVLPHVFDRYVRANHSPETGGLGLGLPLVRSLVESHGGRVEVASEGDGRGSEFRVRLPRSRSGRS
jgi:signal transduction histidine kinase